jgi:cytochrome P450
VREDFPALKETWSKITPSSVEAYAAAGVQIAEETQKKADAAKAELMEYATKLIEQREKEADKLVRYACMFMFDELL